MNNLETVAKDMYNKYRIKHTDKVWTFPAWSLLPAHAKDKWYDAALLSGNVKV